MPKMISYGTSVTAFSVMMSVGRESPKHRRDMGWGHTHNPSQHPHPEHPGYSSWLLVLSQEINYFPWHHHSACLISHGAFMHHCYTRWF